MAFLLPLAPVIIVVLWIVYIFIKYSSYLVFIMLGRKEDHAEFMRKIKSVPECSRGIEKDAVEQVRAATQGLTPTRNMRNLVRAVVTFLPLALAPLFLALLAEGTIHFGGGEKDLVWVIPWTVGALAFAAASLVLWRQGAGLPRSVAVSTLFAVAALLALAVVLAAIGKLGVAGRF